MAPPIRDKVFISYSHKDREWFEYLQTMMQPLNRSGAVLPWDDTMIRTGADWHEHIQTALSTAKVGVMLVSPNFLASDFIAEVELPALLTAAVKEGLQVCWILVSACLHETSELSRFQAAHDISRPLDKLTPAELNETLASIAREIHLIRLANTPSPPPQEPTMALLTFEEQRLLAELLEKSGRLGMSASRRVLLIEIGRDPTSFRVEEGNAQEFAVLLIYELATVGNREALQRIIALLVKDLPGFTNELASLQKKLKEPLESLETLQSAGAGSNRARAFAAQREIIQKPAEVQRLLRVFLCHSSGDKPAVRTLYHRLHAEGVAPWLDEEDLLPGQDWQQEIPKAVRLADVVIVCLSRQSITKAGYVQKEIKYALDVAAEQPEGTIFVIPLKLEECDVPEQLRRWHWVNVFEERGYERLRRALQARATVLGLTID